MYDAILTGRNAANNVSEGWNNVFATMVGHHHPSLWCLIGALQHDQAMVATALLQNARGQPPAKRCKALGSAQALLTSSAVSAVTAHAVSRTRCVPSDIVSDSSWLLLAERRCCLLAISQTGVQRSAKYSGALRCRQRWTVTQNKYECNVIFFLAAYARSISVSIPSGILSVESCIRPWFIGQR